MNFGFSEWYWSGDKLSGLLALIRGQASQRLVKKQQQQKTMIIIIKLVIFFYPPRPA